MIKSMNLFDTSFVERFKEHKDVSYHQLDDISLMKINIEKQKYKICDAKKTARGQYNTTKATWLFPQVQEFIESTKLKNVTDPFAGKGDLLKQLVGAIPDIKAQGFDIDPNLGWPINDSLMKIPELEKTLIVTNPPYLANFSAKRKGVLERVEKYYRLKSRSDLYQVAIDACLENSDHIVAIIPETIINSNYPLENFVSITIVSEHMFLDTEQPVVVACISKKWNKGPVIYRNDEYINSLKEIVKFREFPNKTVKIKFNDPLGRIGLRAVDLPAPDKRISFMPANLLKYDKQDVKHSSRLITCISLETPDDEKIGDLCVFANQRLEYIRKMTQDVILSPFKGNAKNGERRRRLDYSLARAILEEAYQEIYVREAEKFQLELF